MLKQLKELNMYKRPKQYISLKGKNTSIFGIIKNGTIFPFKNTIERFEQYQKYTRRKKS